MAAAVLAVAQSAALAGNVNMTFDTDPTLAATQTPGAWYTDRFAPAQFESAFFDGDNRLLHGLAGSDVQANSFYNYQGRKYDVDLTGSQITVKIDLYVGSDWGSTDRNAGIWGTGLDALDNISAYPILAYRNSSTTNAGFYTFDYINGGWQNETAISDFGRWYELSFVLTPGTGVEYFLNGSSIGTQADTDTVKLANVILNAYNFGYDQSIYWDNFQATAVPLPGAAPLGLALLGGLGALNALRRRRRAARAG